MGEEGGSRLSCPSLKERMVDWIKDWWQGMGKPKSCGEGVLAIGNSVFEKPRDRALESGQTGGGNAYSRRH